MTINVTIIKNNVSPFSFQSDTWEDARRKVARIADNPNTGIKSSAPVFMSDIDAKIPSLEQHAVGSIRDDNREDGLSASTPTSSTKKDAEDARTQRAENFIRLEEIRRSNLEHAIIDTLRANGDSTLVTLRKAAGRTDTSGVLDALTRLISGGAVITTGSRHYRAL